MRQRNNLNSPSVETCFSFSFLPPHLQPSAACSLSVWMSVKLLPVYQTLMTNTVANTTRLLVLKKVLHVRVSSVWVCVCVLIRSLSRAPSRLSCERRSVEAEMHFHVRQNVLQPRLERSWDTVTILLIIFLTENSIKTFFFKCFTSSASLIS